MNKLNQRAKFANRNDYDDEDDDDGVISSTSPIILPYDAFETSVSCRKVSYYLSKGLTAPSGYVEMIHDIRTATANDEIDIYLNNVGGRTDTGIQLLNAIRESEATITTILDAQAFSMTALLFLSGHHQRVGDNAQLMFHHYSSGIFGKGNEQVAEVRSTEIWFSKLMQNVCSPFLKKKEIKDVLGGKDIWMDSEEIQRRLDKQQELDKKASSKKKKKKSSKR